MDRTVRLAVVMFPTVLEQSASRDRAKRYDVCMTVAGFVMAWRRLLVLPH